MKINTRFCQTSDWLGCSDIYCYAAFRKTLACVQVSCPYDSIQYMRSCNRRSMGCITKLQEMNFGSPQIKLVCYPMRRPTGVVLSHYRLKKGNPQLFYIKAGLAQYKVQGPFGATQTIHLSGMPLDWNIVFGEKLSS